MATGTAGGVGQLILIAVSFGIWLGLVLFFLTSYFFLIIKIIHLHCRKLVKNTEREFFHPDF